MSLQNCPECGKVFVKRLYDLCDECRKKEEEEFNKVYEFLKKEPLSNIEKVEKETGVDRKKLLKFLREGRIEILTYSSELKCMNCGKPVKKGRLCESCAKEFKEKLEEAKRQKEIKEEDVKEITKSRMYILDRILERAKKEEEEK